MITSFFEVVHFLKFGPIFVDSYSSESKFNHKNNKLALILGQKSPFGELCSCVLQKWGHAKVYSLLNKLARLARSEIMFEKIRDALECEPRLSRTNIRLPKNLCKFAVQPFKLRDLSLFWTLKTLLLCQKIVAALKLSGP